MNGRLMLKVSLAHLVVTTPRTGGLSGTGTPEHSFSLFAERLRVYI